MKKTAQAKISAATGVTIASAIIRRRVVDSLRLRSIRWNRNETQTPSRISPNRTNTICSRCSLPVRAVASVRSR
jgi:hypothetical protein